MDSSRFEMSPTPSCNMKPRGGLGLRYVMSNKLASPQLLPRQALEPVCPYLPQVAMKFEARIRNLGDSAEVTLSAELLAALEGARSVLLQIKATGLPARSSLDDRGMRRRLFFTCQTL